MKENQNIEWKESWRDEFGKWICGFANAIGGKLFIGINDKGIVTGVAGADKLLEDIPNKMRDILGIIIDVDLKTKDNKDYLEITVPAYPYPVSYKEQYHYRSGSTKQELKGIALDRFLLQKQGKRWDGIPMPNVLVDDLSNDAFESFRKQSAKTKRLSQEVLQENNAVLIDKLHLNDGNYLKRAAILLFHPDPEKYVTGAYVKIGFFKTDDDLLFHDEIHGYLFAQVEKTMDLLLTKYLRANIRYEGLNRIEEYPFPEAALREALLNAIAHKDYSTGNPIQISVYDHKIIFWNEGQLPDNWTVENLVQKHPSKPFNPDIATTFFRAGLIEAWGRGTLKIIKECTNVHLPAPIFKYDLSGFVIEFDGIAEVMSGKMSGKLLKLIKENEVITIRELADKIGVTQRTIERNIKILQNNNQLERIGSTKSGKWKIKNSGNYKTSIKITNKQKPCTNYSVQSYFYLMLKKCIIFL